MTIIALIGPSGAGKTTIAEEMSHFGIPQICSYTTRPMRKGERQGREHLFVSRREAAHHLMVAQPLAYTLFGGNHYFALFDQLKAETMTYIVDEQGLMDLRYNIGEYHDRMSSLYGLEHERIRLLPVYVDRDIEMIARSVDADRIERDEDRIDLDPALIRLRIENDARSKDELLAWSKDFAQAIVALLSVRDVSSEASIEQRTVYTSQRGVAHIIAAMNGAVI